MAMKTLFKYCFIGLMLVGCGSNKQFSEQDLRTYEDLKTMVESKSFEIISNYARPTASVAFSRVADSRILGAGNSMNHIDISSNTNNLTVSGDTIRAFLPYYGEQTFGSGYNGNHTGIEFNDVPKDYQVYFNDQKHTANIHFKINDQYRGHEPYAVLITLYKNNKSSIRVMSSYRTTIEYTGHVSDTSKF